MSESAYSIPEIRSRKTVNIILVREEDLPNIWDKFYKVDKARTREYGGSGIGLSIVKAIMESHHRECGAKNRENGVEFWFELDRDCANNS